MVTNSNFFVRNSIVSRNIAQQAGAGIKVVGGIAQIFSSQINDNMAKDYGAAFDITTQGILSAVKTIVYVNNSEISNNWATHRGAAFLLDALDEFQVSNSIIRNNSGTTDTAAPFCILVLSSMNGHDSLMSLCSMQPLKEELFGVDQKMQPISKTF